MSHIPLAKYRANAVLFDGATSRLDRGADLTGVADGKVGTLSVWLKFDATGDGAGQGIVSTAASAPKFTLQRQAAGTFILVGRNAAGSIVMLFNSAGSGNTSSAGWIHLLASWDLAAGTIQQYVDDASDISVTTNTNDVIDYTQGQFTVGNFASNYFDGLMADFWFDPGTHIDLSIEANRRKFIDGAGRPVFAGDDGSLPTGATPAVFLSGPGHTWHSNRGTGGGLTLTGLLVASLDTPSA